jgi:hypothetical protein
MAIIGLTLDTLFWKTALDRILWRHLAAIGFAGAILIVLFALRKRPREWVGAAAFLLNNSAILAAFWASDQALASSSERWTPFEVEKLGALTIALLAPPRAWVGLLAIAETTAVPLVEYMTWGPAVRARLPAAAPWIITAYGVFAFLLYGHQLRRQASERRAASAHAEALALERVARLVLSMRDLANTPLQIIELTVALLRKRQAHEPLVARLERAAERLVAIGQALESERLDLLGDDGAAPAHSMDLDRR